MKAFIVAALLVASVAGQSLDMYKTMNKEMTHSNKGIMSQRYLKNYPANYYYGGDYSNMINGDYDYPYTADKYYGVEEEYNCLSYEQITAHPLFREYMALPLFRQYWSYPMFQRYVCSHYFQQYWTMPAFQQYFVQPSMFYKYIYPIVQLYKYDAATSTYNYNNGRDYYSFLNKNVFPVEADYFQGQQQQQKFVPTVCRYNSVYCRALVQKMYNHLMYTMTNQEETTTPMEFNGDMYKYNPYYARMMYPTVYNKEYYPTVYNKEYFPTVYNKDFYPTVYNKEYYPTVYNKEFQNFEVPSRMVINKEQEMIHPMFNRAMIQGKTFGENKFQIPEQVIKA